jgi:hypothetical protein
LKLYESNYGFLQLIPHVTLEPSGFSKVHYNPFEKDMIIGRKAEDGIQAVLNYQTKIEREESYEPNMSVEEVQSRCK